MIVSPRVPSLIASWSRRSRPLGGGTGSATACQSSSSSSDANGGSDRTNVPRPTTAER